MKPIIIIISLAHLLFTPLVSADQSHTEKAQQNQARIDLHQQFQQRLQQHMLPRPDVYREPVIIKLLQRRPPGDNIRTYHS